MRKLIMGVLASLTLVGCEIFDDVADLQYDLEVVQDIQQNEYEKVLELQNTIDALTEELQQTEAELQTAIDLLAEATEAEIADVRETIVELNETLADEVEALVAADTEIRQTVETVSSTLSDDIADVVDLLESEIEALDIELTEDIADALQESKEYADANDSDTVFNPTSLNNAIAAINNNIDNIEEDVQANTEAIANINATLSTVSSTLSSIDTALTELSSNANVTSETLASLKSQADQLRTDLTSWESVAKSNLDNIQSLTNSVTLLETKTNNLKTEIEELGVEVEDITYANIYTKLYIQDVKWDNRPEFDESVNPSKDWAPTEFTFTLPSGYEFAKTEFSHTKNGITVGFKDATVGGNTATFYSSMSASDIDVDGDYEFSLEIGSEVTLDCTEFSIPEISVDSTHLGNLTFTYVGSDGGFSADADKISLSLIVDENFNYTISKIEIDGNDITNNFNEGDNFYVVKAPAPVGQEWAPPSPYVHDSSNVWYAEGGDGIYTIDVTLVDQCDNTIEVTTSATVGTGAAKTPASGKVKKPIVI